MWPLLPHVSNGEEVKVCRALVNLRAVWYLWEAVWEHKTSSESVSALWCWKGHGAHGFHPSSGSQQLVLALWYGLLER